MVEKEVVVFFIGLFVSVLKLLLINFYVVGGGVLLLIIVLVVLFSWGVGNNVFDIGIFVVLICVFGVEILLFVYLNGEYFLFL